MLSDLRLPLRRPTRPILLSCAAALAAALLAPVSAWAGQEAHRARQEAHRARQEARSQAAEERAGRRGARRDSTSNAPSQSTGDAPSETGEAPSETGEAPSETGEAPSESSSDRTLVAGTRSSLGGSCAVDVEATSSLITAGEPVVLHGRFVCAEGVPAAGQPVTVFQREARVHGFSIAGTATTEADGSYQLTLEDLRASSVFYVRCDGLRSARIRVAVAPQVTVSASRAAGEPLLIGGADSRAGRTSSVATGNVVTFTGTISPAEPGARVALQRQNTGGGEHWHRIAVAQVGPGGVYSITHTFRSPGEANIRVVAHNRGNVAGASEPLSYPISQRQNPRLTIRASANPISSGQSVTITGTAAGAADQPVTLLAQARGGSFAAVAEASTNSSGEYVFPAQTPVRSTAYKVVDSATSSSVLREGVTYALTAAPSSTSIQAGQPLVFTGTVTPAPAGQQIYLERQNASGLGFHIVAVGTVNPDSSYSIQDALYGSGAAILRIVVPGGESGNLSKASEPFTIQVMPAPASTLSSAAPPAQPLAEDEGQ